MSIAFANVKSIVIPEGNVTKLTINGVDVWSSAPPTPPAPPEWQALFDSISAGTYKTDYSIGDLIPLDLGTEGAINMQIAGIDCDELAAGGNFAAVSLISKQVLNTKHIMNPTKNPNYAPYNEGTGSIGGWEKSEMRSYLKDTIKPLIPTTVRNAIVEVTKKQISYTTTGSSEIQTTTDDVWIPSLEEVNASYGTYRHLYPNQSSRGKKKIDGSNSAWWTRSGQSEADFYLINASGSEHGYTAFYASGIALGFCIGVGAPLPSASLLLSTMTRPTAYNPTLDSGDEISDAEALSIITGGEYR